jgi:fatty-acyl-CoA synthase
MAQIQTVKGPIATDRLGSGASATEEDIVARCRDGVAGFKKTKRVFFTDDIPKNVSGKILKRELRDRDATF